jgi:hypothetical protein
MSLLRVKILGTYENVNSYMCKKFNNGQEIDVIMYTSKHHIYNIVINLTTINSTWTHHRNVHYIKFSNLIRKFARVPTDITYKPSDINLN